MTTTSVLVVDDTPGKLAALEAALAPLGCRLVTASSGEGCLRRLLAEDFACILLDVKMTGMDGFECAELIRLRRRSERTPIIFVTAFDQAEAEMARGFALGAVDFIFSPIVPEVLRNKVGVFLDLHEKADEVQRQAQRLRELEAAEHRRRIERSEQRRRAAEVRFETMLDIAGDAILAVDDAGSIVLFNRAAETTFGIPAAAAIGSDVHTVLPDGLLDDPPAGAAVGGPVPTAHREATGRRADGGEFPAELSVAWTRDGERTLRTLVVRDVTERRRAHEEARRLNQLLDQRLRTGIGMVADMAASLEPAIVFARIVERAVAAVEASGGALLGIDPAGERLVVEQVLEAELSLRGDARLGAQPLLLRALEERSTVVSGPFEPAELPVLRWRQPPRHVAVTPLALEDAVVAMLVVARHVDQPFGSDDVEMLGLIGMVAVAALRNAELYRQAQESVRSKSDFLNLAAHELRTPLSVVVGYASMLGDGSLGPQPDSYRRPIEVLGTKAGELNALIEDLLAAARADAGRLGSQLREVDLVEVIEAAMHRVEPRARLAEAELGRDLPSEPVLADTDPAHVARILDNLLNNAITYSPSPPWVRVTLDSEDGAHRIRVEDHGVGIPGHDHEHVFERFTRLSHPTLGPRPGTGLGLYISRKLTEEIGGRLSVESSEPGSGTVMALRLPAVRSGMAVELPGERTAGAARVNGSAPRCAGHPGPAPAGAAEAEGRLRPGRAAHRLPAQLDLA